eukprot:7331909-Lingulodinium_polyedra.AAC.1
MTSTRFGAKTSDHAFGELQATGSCDVVSHWQSKFHVDALKPEIARRVSKAKAESIGVQS